MLKIDSVECTEDTIFNGSYKVQRNFNLITKKDAKPSAPSESFFKFMISPKAAPLIKKAGVVPTHTK